MGIKYLSGSSKDRRKQLRKLNRDNPNAVVNVYAPSVVKIVNGVRTHCEDANTPRTIVVIKGDQ